MKKKKVKKIILIIITIIIIFVVGLLIGRKTVSGNQKINFDVSTESKTSTVEVDVGTKTIQNTLTNSGEIASSGTEKISLDTSKYFYQMCTESDDTVLEGENILEYTDGTYLTAPYNCVISESSVPSVNGRCTSSNYVSVQNLKTLSMTLSIDESEINQVSVGDEVEIELSSNDEWKYTGSISKIDSIGTYSSSGSVFTANVKFENDRNAKIGMSASCTIIIEEAENCIAVPISAVQTSGDMKYVIVKKDDGTTENVTVETGISDSDYVEIKSGLSGGEKIQMVQTSSKNSMQKSFNNGMMQSFDSNSNNSNREMKNMQSSGMSMPSSKSE